MSIRKIPILNSEYYHVYNRGNSKQKIFLDEEDYLRFVKLLYLCNSDEKINFRTDITEKGIDAWNFERGKTLVSIGSWVLMPNHFHLYITGSRSLASGEHNNAIIVFVQKLSTAYAKYFNAKHSHTGSLFEGKFKAVHVKDDIQSKYLISYIHLNPMKLIQPDWKENGIKDFKLALNFLSSYRWSSFNYYKGKELQENAIINSKDFPNYFDKNEDFEKEIFEWFSRSLASGNL